MSYHTVPAVVHAGDWTTASRSHPVLKLLEDWSSAVDSDRQVFAQDLSRWYTEDYTWQRPSGAKYQGREESWKRWTTTFSVANAMYHQIEHIVVLQGNDAKTYDIIVTETLFVRFEIPPDEEELRTRDLPKDRNGTTWDWAYRIMVRHKVVEHEGRLKFASTSAFCDVYSSLEIIVRRGILPTQILVKGRSDG